MTVAIQQLIWKIERIRDAFHQALYAAADLDAALAVTAADCVLVNLPVGTGASTQDGLRRHLAEEVLPHLPADLTFRRVSRTVDKFRLVEEAVVGFTHDREMPWLLPGAPPTHRRAEVLAISVVTVRHKTAHGGVDSRITAHRTLWDHSGLLAQLHLAPLPGEGQSGCSGTTSTPCSSPSDRSGRLASKPAIAAAAPAASTGPNASIWPVSGSIVRST
jgi:carboxymethylenebutenolidase